VELPRLKPIYEKHKGNGLEFVAVDRTNDTEGALQFIEENGLEYRFLENGEEEAEVVRRVFGVRTFPTTYLINEESKILYAHVGFTEGDEEIFDEQIASVLN
jgi:hypothetical protein